MATRWDCRRCHADLGTIREGALHVQTGVTIRTPRPGVVEIVCRCGHTRVWFGGRVIVSRRHSR